MSADPLAELVRELAVPTAVPVESEHPVTKPGGAIQKVNYTHDAMINLILAQPGISQNKIAAHFGYSASWVSLILSSDAFKARLAERSKELVDPTLRATIEEQFVGIVARSIAVVQEKLNKPPDQIPDNFALRALEISSRAAGYGAKDTTPPVTPVEMHLHLDNLGNRLTGLLQRKKDAILDAELVEKGE